MDAVSPYDAGTRHIHLLLAVLGIAALVSGQSLAGHAVWRRMVP